MSHRRPPQFLRNFHAQPLRPACRSRPGVPYEKKTKHGRWMDARAPRLRCPSHPHGILFTGGLPPRVFPGSDLHTEPCALAGGGHSAWAAGGAWTRGWVGRAGTGRQKRARPWKNYSRCLVDVDTRAAACTSAGHKFHLREGSPAPVHRAESASGGPALLERTCVIVRHMLRNLNVARVHDGGNLPHPLVLHLRYISQHSIDIR